MSDNQSRRKLLFRALSHRNYRLFYFGQGISLIGTWMQQIAMIWLVYRITGSAFMLGLVAFCGQIPTFFLAPMGGVIADRWNRHRLMVFNQSVAMLQAFILAFLTLTHLIQVWIIIPLGIILGIVNSFDMPVRQSFIIEMVDNRDDLANAIALNSSLVNAARLIGPSIAGIIVATVGEGLCFLFNGISYIAVILALLAMRIKEVHRPYEEQHVFEKLKEGFLYVVGFRPIRSILLLLGLMSLMGVQAVIMPVYVKEILHGGPHEFGFLMAAMGCGSLTGAVYLAGRKNVRGLIKRIGYAASLFGVSLLILSVTKVFLLAVIIIYSGGLGMMMQMASSNTIIQTLADDDKRGRVMSFYAMAFLGMAPFGSFLAGTLTTSIGISWTMALGGVICLIGAGLFMRDVPKIQEIVRPIYIKKGIIKDDSEVR